MNDDFLQLPDKQIPYWLLIAVLLLCLWGIQKTYRVTVTSQPDQNIGRGIEHYQSESKVLSFEAIQELPDAAWQTQQREQISLKLAGQSYWLRFQMPHLNNLENWLLEVDYTQLDELSVWFMTDDKLLAQYNTGDRYPFRSRTINHERFLFPVPVTEQQETIRVFMKVQNTTTVKLPIHLWKEKNYLVYAGEHSMAMGLFFGFMLAMALSNFFFFVTSGSRNFLLYAAYAASVALLLFSLHGMAYKYLWPGSIWLQNHAVGVFANASLLFAILFIRKLLNLGKHSAAVDNSLRLISIMFILFVVISLFANTHFFHQAFLGLVLLVVVYIFLTGLWLWKSGLQVSRIYALAWCTLLISASLAALDGLELLHIQLRTRYLLMMGASIETVLLALLLAMNYSRQSKELLATRERALKQEKQITAAKEALLDSQQQANEDLEYAVQERTLELEITLRELAEKNQELEEKNTLDALTGVRNRRHFDKKYVAELRRSRREHTIFAVAMVDIDHFKNVNDTYGHLVGDDCIRFVAGVIQSYLKRPSDDVYRYGGEEFAVLMPSTDVAGATLLMEKIREHIASHAVPHEVDGLNLTVSIGVSATVVTSQLPDDTILSQADQALYRAKESGRNRVVSHQDDHKSVAVTDGAN